MPIKNIQEDMSKLHEFIFENANDIIFYLEEDGTIISANKMAAAKYGYSLDELLSLNIQDIRDSSMDSDYIDQMIISKKNGIIFEGIHVKKDGTTFPVEVSSRTIEFKNDILRIHIIRDTTDRRRIDDKTLHLAKYDSLTNIANRGNILLQLDSAIETAQLIGKDLAFIIFDIDKFKIINDTFGHPVGDKVLKYIAQTVKGLLRGTDSIGRFGGDEFVIIQLNIKNRDDILALVNRIIDAFKSPKIFGEHSIQINISIGISLLSESPDRDTLIYQADSAMYIAKKRYGCTYEFYSNI